MPEVDQPPAQPESLLQTDIPDQIHDAFEKRINNLHIKDTYVVGFQRLIDTMPSEQQNTVSVRMQKSLVAFRGWGEEMGARYADFMRNLIFGPVLRTSPDIKKDKYVQMAKEEARVWVNYALKTQEQATKERNAYKNNFLPTAVLGGKIGALAGAVLAFPLAVGAGVVAGVPAGVVVESGGIAAGTGIGGALGGLNTLVMRIRDRIIGPPVSYYEFRTFSDETIS